MSQHRSGHRTDIRVPSLAAGAIVHEFGSGGQGRFDARLNCYATRDLSAPRYQIWLVDPPHVLPYRRNCDSLSRGSFVPTSQSNPAHLGQAIYLYAGLLDFTSKGYLFTLLLADLDTGSWRQRNSIPQIAG